jgi:hypothetical protein
MKLKVLLLIIAVIFLSQSFLFCKAMKNHLDTTEEKNSISFLHGYFIGVRNIDNIKPIFGFSLNAPIGNKLFIVPEYLLINSENPKNILQFFSLLLEYRICNIKSFNLSIQNGFGVVFFTNIQYQIGLSTDIEIIDDIKIGFECRLLPTLSGDKGPYKLYAINIGINF